MAGFFFFFSLSAGFSEQFELSNLSAYKKTNKSEILWHVTPKKPFTELIVSWNAHRPSKGHFSFLVSVQHEKGWSSWAKIAQWGADFQKTFLSTKDQYVKVKHVRTVLEKVKGHSFRVKVKAEEGADIKKVKKLFANTANEYSFKFNQMPSAKLASLTIKDVPCQSQKTFSHARNHDLCSPTSTGIVTKYHLKSSLDCLHKFIPGFAHNVYDSSLDIYGNWLFNTAQVFAGSHGKLQARVVRLNSFDDLYTNYLKKNIPVPVSIRAHAGQLTGAFIRIVGTQKKSYENGHFVVVTGWDAKARKVICVDPAFTKKSDLLKKYDSKEFMRAWDKSRHLAYEIHKI